MFLTTKSGETSIATLRAYKTNLRDFLDWLGERHNDDLNEIRTADMANYRNHLLSRVSQTTATNKIKSLKAMFTAACKDGSCLQEPTANLKLKKKAQSQQNAERRAFTLDELKVVREVGEWESMILFGLYTGQRLGDLATLKWSNINLQKEELRIQTRKTGRSITIPLAPPLLDYLLTQVEAPDDPNVYLHPRIAESYAKGSATASNQFTALLSQCGLRDSVSHQSKDKGRGNQQASKLIGFGYR